MWLGHWLYRYITPGNPSSCVHLIRKSSFVFCNLRALICTAAAVSAQVLGAAALCIAQRCNIVISPASDVKLYSTRPREVDIKTISVCLYSTLSVPTVRAPIHSVHRLSTIVSLTLCTSVEAIMAPNHLDSTIGALLLGTFFSLM